MVAIRISFQAFDPINPSWELSVGNEQLYYHSTDTPWALYLTSPKPISPNWKRHHFWSLCFTRKSGKEGQRLLRKHPSKLLISTVLSLNVLLSPSHRSLKCNIEKLVLCCNSEVGRKQNCKILIFTDRIPVA